MGMGGQGADLSETQLADNSETVHISLLALLKMLKHGRAGVPMEVMGLMLGEFVDDYTVRVVDVFAMPQSGTGVVVGWYHSHPGFGCWLSSVDIGTQQGFERLNSRAVAVVIDPIQSVRGKVVIDAFRLIESSSAMSGMEPRQSTSNIGQLHKPSIQALIHGLNRHYYSLDIDYRKNQLEEKMLLNLNKKQWSHGLALDSFDTHCSGNQVAASKMLKLAESYTKSVQEEQKLTAEELKTRHVGKQDPKRYLESTVVELMSNNIVQALGTAVDEQAM
ncbi:multicatalytic endopeptidase [Coemansia sp. RSA 1199]|nr:multicatalytic endopeptidase [Coemansia sp. RSA 1199]